MPSKFDLYGWYAGEGEGARTTPLAPANTSQTTTPGELRANFTGHVWIDRPYVAPVIDPPAEPAPAVYDWYIDVGPFFDRFDTAKMSILTSSNATVGALVRDLQVRKWIDLKRADVAAGIDALISLAVPGVTPALKTAVLTTPVTAEENFALRRVYFSQP